MTFREGFLGFWQKFMNGAQVVVAFLRRFFAKTAKILEKIILWFSKFKKIIAAVPVAAGAIILALYNMGNLPRVVGINLLENGSFTYQVPKGIAVFAPVAITSICLLLMFCSRRILTPWIVSVISLLLPIVILITNIFPA